MSNVEQHDDTNLFDLVYHGATDDSVRTIQRIKGVFVGDLNLTIPDVQRILDHAPSTISSAGSTEELEDAKRKLTAAGATVLIIQRISNEAGPHGDTLVAQILEERVATTDDETGEETPDTIEFLNTPNKKPAGNNDEFCFEFDLGSEDRTRSVQNPPKDKPPKVYALDIDESENVDDLVKSFDQISGTDALTESSPQEDPVVQDLTNEDSDDTATSSNATADEAQVSNGVSVAHDSSTPTISPQASNRQSAGINLLTQDELNAFHLSRGGSLEAPPPVLVETEIDESMHFEPTPISEVPLDLHPEQPSPHFNLASQHSATEVALVLESLSDDSDESAPSTPTATQGAAVSPTPTSAPSIKPTTPIKPLFQTPPSSSPAISLSMDLEEPADSALADAHNGTGTSPSTERGVKAHPIDVATAPNPSSASSSAGKVVTTHTPANASAGAETVEIIPETNATSSTAPEAATHPLQPGVEGTKRRPSSRNKKPRSWIELAIPIVLGSTVLGLGNWMYFSSAPPMESSKLVAKPNLEASKAAELPAPTAIPLKIWEPSRDEGSRVMSARVAVGPKKTVLESFVLETPKPRQRTAEEIARGVILPTWLRKVEAGPFQFKSPPSGSKETALHVDGPAVVYLMYAGERTRIGGNFSATLDTPSRNSPYRLRFKIQAGETPTAEGMGPLSVTRNGDGSYSIYAEGILEFGRAYVGAE